ncbi:hypothetical protein [Staphylococcus capitis]|uniref:hypothetical protein n=1 Tax=Staphylococcus capitis TaxID=29388 RepID=UPI003D057440
MRIVVEQYTDEQDGQDHSRTHEIVAHELTHRESADITRALAKQGIKVEPAIDIFHVLHLWAKTQLTTHQVTVAIGAYRKVTDARIAYHPAGA